MNELIKIEINENNEQLVSAKELHEFLEVKSKFADWIKNRIEKYGFEENQDFVTVSKNLENGGREIDYILKLDTAKELAMAENNEKKEKKMELMKKDLIMTSLEIAEITEKRHDHVLRDIREEIASLESEGLGGQLIFGASSYKNSQNKEQPMYTMGREGAIQIATRYSAAIRRKLIMKLEELENKIKVPTTLKEALQLALEQQEKLEKQQLVIQEKSKIIKEKVEVIDNLTEDVDSVLLRKIATDYVSKKAKETSKPHPEIWGDIYGLFGREWKIV